MINKINLKSKLIIFTAFSLLLTTYSLLLPSLARAVCPICTVAVGAGLGLSRWLGIDDTISGIWIGGLLMSVSFWTIDWLNKKNFKITKNLKKAHITLLSFSFWFVLTLVPLWMGGIIGHPFNTILGVDKVLFGVVAGSLMFLAGMWADKKVRKVRGKQLFSYQKVAFPVVSLVILSLVVYYYGGYLY